MCNSLLFVSEKEEVVTFRVSRKTKSKMDKLRKDSGVNWSNMLRGFIEELIEKEERRSTDSKDLEKRVKAVEKMDRLAKLSKGSGWIGSAEVISWRKKRYSYQTQASS